MLTLDEILFRTVLFTVHSFPTDLTNAFLDFRISCLYRQETKEVFIFSIMRLNFKLLIICFITCYRSEKITEGVERMSFSVTRLMLCLISDKVIRKVI